MKPRRLIKRPLVTPFSSEISFPVYWLLMILFGADGLGQVETGTPLNTVGSGARTLGMGNAFIAIADDATAASWNPAGLIHLQRPEFSFAVEALLRSEQLNSSSNPESKNRETLSLGDLNYASLVYPFFFKTNMVLSMNFLKLYRFDKETEFRIIFGDIESGVNFANDQSEISQEGSFSVLAPALSIYITEKLSLGVSFNIWNHALTTSSEFEKKEVFNRESSISGNSIQFLDVTTDRFQVDQGYSFVIGGFYRFNQAWNLGFVIKPDFPLDLNQNRITKITETLGSSEPEPDPPVKTNFDSELEFPFILGFGVGWRPADTVTFSMDLTWTDWSDYVLTEKREARDSGQRSVTTVKNPISGRPLDEGKLQDTFTARLGFEYLLIRDGYLVPFRWGLGYDPSPAIDKVDDFYTISLGTGLQVGHYNLDIAWEFRWGNNVNSDAFIGFDAAEDIRQHRILTSFIYYF